MPDASFIRRVPRAVVALFFGALLLLGGMLFADYGVSWDEPVDRMNGLVSLRYAAGQLAPGWAARQPRLQNLPAFEGYADNDHGVLFELPLALFEVLRPGNNPRTYYLMRHAAVFLVSMVGCWALFRLGTRRFRDERLGLLAAGLLVLSPRFFAESFYNGKDLVFLAAFTVGAYTLARLLARPSAGRALVHALATAAAIDVRILGLLLVPFTLALLGLQLLGGSAPRPWRTLLGVALTYVLATAAATVAGWPYLWASPWQHFWQAFHNLSRFRWDGVMLYLGEQVHPDHYLPWHYGPVWMNITTPVAYQLAALLGLAVAAGALLRRPWQQWRTTAGQLDLLLLAWLGLPLAMIINLHSVIYDGWRHLYFVYPALLLLAVRGGLAIAQWGQRSPGRRRLALGLATLASLEAVSTAARMAWMHPHQQTYFSYLPRRTAERLFERDYWALSYRQGLEYVVRQQPTGPVYIDVTHIPPLDNNKVWLSAADQARLVMAPGKAGRYFISAYRHTDTPYPDSVGREVFAVHADGIKILSVFQRDQPGTGK